MKLGDIYKHKKNGSIIQIDSFAAHMNTLEGDVIIVFRNIEDHGKHEIGYCPSFNGYGTQKEIEAEYELALTQEELRNFSEWEEVFEAIERKIAVGE